MRTGSWMTAAISDEYDYRLEVRIDESLRIPSTRFVCGRTACGATGRWRALRFTAELEAKRHVAENHETPPPTSGE